MKYSRKEKKRFIVRIAAVILVCVTGMAYLLMQGNMYIDSKDDSEITDISEEAGIVDISDSESQGTSDNGVSGKIIVHVCGAVLNGGVYELDGSARVADAVEAAGGFDKTADKEYINLAESLTDGQKIIIYTKKEVKKFQNNNDKSSHSDVKSSGVNINTATKQELMTLPGIGESKADDIISYRNENGGFKSIDELMKISGIKEGIFSKISSNITVE